MTRTRATLLSAGLAGLLIVARGPLAGVAQAPQKPLQIYVVDVEGGNAVLYVAPSGESVLIDTGNTGPGALRDAEDKASPRSRLSDLRPTIMVAACLRRNYRAHSPASCGILKRRIPLGAFPAASSHLFHRPISQMIYGTVDGML